MFIDFMISNFEEFQSDDAIIWDNRGYSYEWLLKSVSEWRSRLRCEGVGPGKVATLEADYSPNAISLFLALLEEGNIVVPLTSVAQKKKEEFSKIAQVEVSCRIASDDCGEIRHMDCLAGHELYGKLRGRKHPGVVLFSSGSTGKSKAILHDMVFVLEKFKERRHRYRTIPFLLFDHIGGLNTMLYTLSNGGSLVVTEGRSPDDVSRVIEQHRVELLPASPTFLNLILLSEVYKDYDLSSLKIITYGTEPMQKSTLVRFHRLFPEAQLLQTYGLSELGILSSKSKNSDSLWVKVGGAGFQSRIVEGILHIRAKSAMMGYLNAPNPFVDDGWFVTGDMVEQDGEYIRFLGRSSEIINVGGEKVFPSEVESVIQELDNIAEVTVFGEFNPIVGQIVCAKVRLIHAEDAKSVNIRIKRHCGKLMERYKVPAKTFVSEDKLYNNRFKKTREKSEWL